MEFPNSIKKEAKISCFLPFLTLLQSQIEKNWLAIGMIGWRHKLKYLPTPRLCSSELGIVLTVIPETECLKLSSTNASHCHWEVSQDCRTDVGAVLECQPSPCLYRWRVHTDPDSCLATQLSTSFFFFLSKHEINNLQA